MTADPADLRFTDPAPRIHGTAELKTCKLGRYAAVGERVVLREVVVGEFSYFERHAEAIYATIGKFCSIAANARINALEHPLERATTHKVSYRPNEYFRYLGVDQGFRERRRGRAVTIRSRGASQRASRPSSADPDRITCGPGRTWPCTSLRRSAPG